ncbi:cystathionine gamma-synthase [Aspergillus nomiae NRRL 13137]|uniref:Cystathionine gamma-synthase n=1 Tax=Aspergillus nomiae NRRL (strain ATCC 15546 / NRRL 13137 / CBS 260.88 / M93) TaxID=1509407 RepID=A0A0L1ILZ5_ASPN3|nr:cystathionine gamma-synthase [Aspergillus nomiae NRRL 13137]KNG80527.1 cystathionine gamma-synthase [Aspergillus nomiae NRRL 13137]
MGDTGPVLEPWMPPQAPQAFPPGKGNIYPFGESHASQLAAVSVSLPTWDSVIGLSRKEKWLLDQLEWDYPRFYLNKPIRDLSDAVPRRLQINDITISCMVFSSAAAGQQCATVLKTLPSENPFAIEVVRFVMPLESNMGDASAHWANFTAVLYPSDLLNAAMAFWRDTGSGLSTRHAEFCLEELGYLDSDSATPAYRTPAPRKRCRSQTPESLTWMRAAAGNSQEVKSFLAGLATSEQPGQPPVSPDDVFLYPTGMNAIYTLSEALASPEYKVAIWLYPQTVDVVRRGTWAECLSYKCGTEEELDRLEALLQSGQQIRALFCELPSNITLASPNLRRIRALADKYGFVVACDDTVVGYVNIDALPYVDVMMSSLTKTFSGASNSCNKPQLPSSRPNPRRPIQNRDTYFPLDVNTLKQNSKNVVWRVKQCNQNTLPLVDLFKAHPAIASVNHPSIAPTSALYKSVMRKDGGYGNVLSVVFHDPRTAEHFYNIFNVCKGSSFGTNFTLAIPFVQLAYYWNQDKVAKHGVPRHIIRISVGLEDSRQIVETARRALKSMDEFELNKDLN